MDEAFIEKDFGFRTTKIDYGVFIDIKLINFLTLTFRMRRRASERDRER